MHKLLTAQQLRVMGFVMKGITDTKELANVFNVSNSTIKAHKNKIIARLGAKNMTHAATIYFRHVNTSQFNSQFMVI